MKRSKYPWKSIGLGESFSFTLPSGNYARGIAWQRKRYGEFWSVHYDKQTNTATFTRLAKPRTVRYNWDLQPGTEQEYRFDSRIEASIAMGRCQAQVRAQNKRAGPDARNWIVAPTEDHLGFTLRRRAT